MNEKDLKPRTKAFALRGIRIYSGLPKTDTVAQVLGKRACCGTMILHTNEETTA